MTTSPAPRDEQAARNPPVSDMPVVDGTATSSEELRAEIEWLSDERREHIETTRAELRDTLDELSTRISGRLRSRRSAFVATLRRRSAQAAGVAAVALGVAGAVVLVRRKR
jgi:hypothetical protein